MRRDDRDDPFDDIFREIERMMEQMAGGVDADAGFGDAHFSVYREDDTVRVVGDLPGATKDSIDIKCDGQHLTIDAATGASEYRERLSLPVSVDEHSATASFNNGVLEVVLEVRGGSGSIDLQ